MSERKRRILKLEKNDIKESSELDIMLNRETHGRIVEPPLLTTDDFPQGSFKQSSSPDKEYYGPSFASMIKKSPSGGVAFSPSRKPPNRVILDENENELSDSVGWTLDLEGMILEGKNSKGSCRGKKKASKKIPLLSNGSLRRRI